MGYAPDFRKQAEYFPVDLIGGDFPLKTESITLEAKQNLKRGAVLGKKTESGKYVLSAKFAGDDKPIADGSEKPTRILAEDIDATNGDTVTAAYKTGSFYFGGISFGKGHSIESLKVDFDTQPRSIFIEG